MPLTILNKYKSLPKQVKASFWFLICSFLQKSISTITTPIFTRLLSTAEYGQYSVFNSWMGIITIFVSLNLYAGVYGQGLVKFDRERSIFSSSLQGLTLSLILSWTVIYLIFRNFWNNLFSFTTVQMLVMLLMIWTTVIFGFWAAEQRVTLSYIKLVAVTLLVSVAKPVIGVIFVINAEDKVTARVLGLALVELIAYFGLFISQMMRGRKFFSAYYWKYALLFNLPLIPHYLSQAVLGSVDRIMIRGMIGESEAGIYNLAYNIAMIMTLFSSALGQTISPWEYQKIKNKQAKSIAPIVYTSLAIVAGVNIILIALAPEVISIFAPAGYRDAIWALPPVAMSVYFMFAYDRFASFEFYFEKSKLIMMASLAAAVMNMILNYVFIPRYGYIAAGYTTLFCYVVYAIGHYFFMKRVCRQCMGGEKIYSEKVLIVLTLVLFVGGFGFLLTYNITVIRYMLVLVLLIVAFIKRGVIIENMTMLLRSKQKQG